MILLDSADRWFIFFGHLHPLIVHLPVGILLLVFVLEWGLPKRKRQLLHEAIVFMLGLGFITAVFSCVAGWLLGMQGQYDATTLNLHRWIGVAVAVISGLCWWLKKKAVFQPRAVTYYTVFLILLCTSLLLTGHFGGTMTHGEDYLTGIWGEEKEDPVWAAGPIENVDEASVYSDLVQRVFHEKCYSCHSAKKVKGGLRVDEEKRLFKGGKHGIVIKPGSPKESELLIRILLPEDDDKRMPPKKEKALTREEIALLQWWIQNGADTRKRVNEFPSSADILPLLASFGTAAGAADDITPVSAVFSKELAPADREVVDSLKRLGVLVSSVTKGSNLLEISCVNYSALGDAQMPQLLRIADNIVSLKMDNTSITDAALKDISKLQNLVRLNLAQTNITSEGVTGLLSLTNLEYLNITATKVTDEGLKALIALPSIKHIYCWRSGVTLQGVEAANAIKQVVIAETR
ncbi:MAG: hypothetical protein KIT80_06140 [Chitinophagaceae bacterium]|nr:hypothetical protein [Chitinophagaceae bacterium]MCW5926474.1 hypothetical protein [Chitinophagaceae bacterium]